MRPTPRVRGDDLRGDGDSNARVFGLGAGLDGAVPTGAVTINDARQIAAQSCYSDDLSHCRSYRLDQVPAAVVRAIEYRHAAFDHYFLTISADEIAKLDNGTFEGWERIGRSFAVRA